MDASVRLGPLAWLAGGLLAGLAAVLAVALGSPFAWAVPAVVVAGLAIAVVRPDGLGWLGIVLALQVFQLGGERGTAALEVVAGLALVAYIGAWYALAIVGRRRVVTSLFDVAAVTWGTVGLGVAAVLGLMFGADAYDFRADVLATIPFLLYLPVKEACVRYDRGPLVVAGVLLLLALTATLQNGLGFYRVITGASQWYQIADARFIVGETAMTAGVMLCLAGAATIPSARARLGTIVLAGVFISGLVLTKSRGFWVSNVFGIGVMVLLAPPAVRRRILVYGTVGLAMVVVLTLLFFAEQVSLIVAGTLHRLLTLAGATSDISLLNRFAESAATWEMIRVNPILGYGWGVQVSYYSILGHVTQHWAFLHNGYLAVWLKTGLWGLAMILAVWGGAIARGVRAARDVRLSATTRAAGLGAAATMIAFTPAAASSNPFSILDQMLVVTLVLALGHGVGTRSLSAGPAAEPG